MTDDTEDAVMRKLLRSKDKVEAKGWLQAGGESHGVGELDHSQSVALVRHLYEMGAVEVMAVKIQTNANLASTDHLIVTLPEEPAKRETIFAWNSERVVAMGFDPDADHGQEHLLVGFS